MLLNSSSRKVDAEDMPKQFACKIRMNEVYMSISNRDIAGESSLSKDILLRLSSYSPENIKRTDPILQLVQDIAQWQEVRC